MSNENHYIDLQRIAPHLDLPVPVQVRFFLKEGVLQKVELAKSQAKDKSVWHVVSQSTDNKSVKRIEEWVSAYLHGAALPDLHVLYPPFAFTRKVLQELNRIPFGTTLSYKEVAERIGSKGSYRAVAGACSRNSVPLVIPCHRVIASDGSLGGFSAGEGVEVKEILLSLESRLLLR
jgi:methylated-DNA-[protein]-cysteine S-methyltransferase